MNCKKNYKENLKQHSSSVENDSNECFHTVYFGKFLHIFIKECMDNLRTQLLPVVNFPVQEWTESGEPDRTVLAQILISDGLSEESLLRFFSFVNENTPSLSMNFFESSSCDIFNFPGVERHIVID